MKVMKFGGTSVGSAESIKQVSAIVSEAISKKELRAVVISAFSKVTDQLLFCAKKAAVGDVTYEQDIEAISERHLEVVQKLIPAKHRSTSLAAVKEKLNDLEELLKGVIVIGECSPKTQDKIVAYGEILSALIVSSVLKEEGLPVIHIDARDILVTDASFGNAEVDFEQTQALISKAFKDKKTVGIVPGFIGRTKAGETTTLGRGGSDYTASILGVALNADLIEIWTDVDGVMTADPRMVPEAISLNEMSYEEAMELSYFGAKVIYPPTIQPAYKNKIPLVIKNTFNPKFEGTTIKESATHNLLITGISSIAQIALLRIQGPGMQGVTGTAQRLFSALSKESVNVILITQASSEQTICVAIDPSLTARAIAAIHHEFAHELERKVLEPVYAQTDCSIISIVGENMRELPGISGRFFYALGHNGVNVIAIAQGSSELNISVVINASDRKKALGAVHEAFFLSPYKKIHIFLVGDGLIGGTLLKQMSEHHHHLLNQYQLQLRLQGITNTKRMLIGSDNLYFSDLEASLKSSAKKASLKSFVDEVLTLNMPNSVFVDCSASEVVPDEYERLLNANVSIVTPNKKGLAGPFARYERFKIAENKHGVSFLYETSVGAGLPVISTLKDLIKSGDQVLEIEAVLSGTLSFIFNSLTADRSFSSIVEEATSLGYTEPDPRDDLSGVDVARKLLILGREMGYPLRMEDVEVESLVPASLRSGSKENFLTNLKKHEAEISRKQENALKQHKKLCYIGSIKMGKAKTSLEMIDSSHPFYSLSGSDNIISFKTRRYSQRPLVVRGPGAGAEVTAAGVFADILRIVS